MALKIRLARGGTRNSPFYRIVVAEATSPRDGKFVEKIGFYNPLLSKDNVERVVLKTDRVKHWLSVGAQPTDRVAKFLGEAKLAPKYEYRETPQKSQPKKKAQERVEAAKQAVQAAKEAAAAPAPEKVAEPEPVAEAPVEAAPEATTETPAE